MNLVKNIEAKMKLTFYVSIASFVTSIIIVAMSFGFATRMINRERSQIYVLDKNIPLVATKSEVGENREAEYKAQIEAFHSLFFSLNPDNADIANQLKRAMYLVDASGIAQYNTLKENGYFTNIVSTSSVITCTTDSILVDMNTKKWQYFAKEKIERPSTITIRSLVTEGYIQDIPRTLNNSHGCLLIHWKTIENKDLNNETKKIY